MKRVNAGHRKQNQIQNNKLDIVKNSFGENTIKI
jgi:hypothetical protein